MTQPAKSAAKKAAVKKSTTKIGTEKVLALRIANAPRLSSAKDAKGRLAGWLQEISRSTPGKSLKALIEIGRAHV